VPPALVLRRALLGWGLGHMALGDRRGVLLLAAETAGVAGLAFLVAYFAEGELSPWVYVAIVAFLAVWGWQAVDAYRRAVELGGVPGGAIQALALAPVALVAFTGFWLFAGSGSSPAAALREYVAAWRDRRPEAASELFVGPVDPGVLAAQWIGQRLYLSGRAAALARGRTTNLDPSRPLDGLVFEITEGPAAPSTGDRQAEAVVEFVRQETVSGSFFGLFPTATQRSVVLERIGSIRLRTVRRPTPVGIPDVVWRIDSLGVPVGPPG
jgi:hypothetical protein